MVSRVDIPETALQSSTLVPKTLVSFNDSYVHEQLEIGWHISYQIILTVSLFLL